MMPVTRIIPSKIVPVAIEVEVSKTFRFFKILLLPIQFKQLYGVK
jgi:hypothetical protein